MSWLAKVESVLEQVDSAVGTGASGRSSSNSNTPRSSSPLTTAYSSSSSTTPLARSSNAIETDTLINDVDQSNIIDELRMRIRTLELDREAQEEVVIALRQKLDQALREKTSEEAEQAVDLEVRNEKTRALEDRIASLEGELQSYAAALGTANAQVQQNKDAVEALKAECTEHVAAAAKASAEIARLQGALHIAQAQVTQAQEAAAAAAAARSNESAKKKEQEEQDDDEKIEGNKLFIAAHKLVKESKTVGDNKESITSIIHEVMEAAVEMLGSDTVDSLFPEQQKNKKEDEKVEEKNEASNVDELRRERDAAIARVEELRRETNKLKTDVLDAQEQLRTSEARVDRLQRQIAAKAVLSAANMQLEARVRTLTEAVSSLQSENHRLQIAHGVVPQPTVDSISELRSSDDAFPPELIAKDSDNNFNRIVEAFDETVLERWMPSLIKTRKMRLTVFLYSAALHLLLVLFFIVAITSAH